MRKLLTILFLLPLYCFSTTYYISPSGNDATGAGTIGNPWRTLRKATSTVSGVGDIIHVVSGTYNETLTSNLAIGVSIEGEGDVSYITSTTISTEFVELIAVNSSTEGTNGNQHISNIKLDGQLTTSEGIKIIGRSNVSVYNCTIVNYFSRGIIFSGRTDNQRLPPAVYSTGNSFHDNIVLDCAQFDHTREAGYGCLNIGGQQNFQCYNNTITQNQRAEGFNGWPIKGYLNGFIKGGRIYSNTLTKKPLGNDLGTFNWDFCIELFDESGLEIDHNVIREGGIDVNHQTLGAYSYSVWIHDNDIKLTTFSTYAESGITIEFNTAYAIIENNVITNCKNGIIFTPRTGGEGYGQVNHVTIQKNRFIDINGGYFIAMSNGESGMVWNTINLYNNTFVGRASNKPQFGIDFPYGSGGSFTNFNYINNIEGNCQSALRHGGSTPLTNLTVRNNDFYAYTVIQDFVGAAPVNYVYTANQTLTPAYNSDYTLQTGSALLTLGINIGLPYTGIAPPIGYYLYTAPPDGNRTVLYFTHPIYLKQN